MEPNLASLAEAIAAAIPERPAIVWRDRRLTYGDLNARTRRLAHHLRSCGLGLRRERAGLAAWESGQDHVALLLYNCPEYLEGMIGAFKARMAPINVNYRYSAAELIGLLSDARARALVYHASFAPTVAEIAASLPDLEFLLQVDDESGEALLPGAVAYEEALAAAPAERPSLSWSADDLYVLYTGGTTGRPKGVLWRQSDIFFAALGGRRPDGTEMESIDEVVDTARRGRLRFMPTGPLMHASHWIAFDALHHGHTVVLPDETRHLDAADVLGAVARHRVHVLVIIGDAFGRPLLAELRRGVHDVSSLRVLGSGGASLDVGLKEELLAALPEGAKILDTMGSSETGTQAARSSRRGATESRTFSPHPGACILSEDHSRRIAPDEAGVGWFAQAGRVPLGYLGDPGKSARTFPEVGGVRYAVPGDRARFDDDGRIEVLGRDSSTINSGGEKIYAEEVEEALKRHPSVYDAIVCGRPSERFGSEVAAVVRLHEGATASVEDLVEECRRHLARYKVPRAIVFRDEIRRSPAGKPDYPWARDQVSAQAGTPDANPGQLPGVDRGPRRR